MSPRRKYYNWPRYILQWGVLIAIVLIAGGILKFGTITDMETYCPMGGLQSVALYLAKATLPCSIGGLQIVMGIAIAAAAMLFGKLFCGYICPIGTVRT